LFLGIKSKKWPEVEGIVTDTKVTQQESKDADSGITETNYLPTITYSYTFGGVEYTSCRVSFEPDWFACSFAKLQDAQKVGDRFLENLSVKVYCNPEKPQQSTILTGVRL
jgi:hypothetical protein